MPLDDILQHGQHLPAIPRVVVELLATFKREDCDADDIARIVSADPALSAKVLRLANSAYYRRARSVTSVRSATVIIGYVALRLLVAGIGIAGGVPAAQGLDRKRFWRYSLQTGVVARYLAPRAGGGADPEAAFSAGLLHAVGHPVIRAAMPEQATELERQTPFCARDRAAVERAKWGFDYAQIGGRLAEQWSFPPELAAAIRHGPEPLKAPEFSTLTAVVRVASDLVAGIEMDRSQLQAAAGVDTELLTRLQLTVDDVRAVPPVEELAAGLESLVM